MLQGSLASTAFIFPSLLRQANGEDREQSGGQAAARPVYNVLDLNANPDGIALNTEPIQRAIDWAARRGGGTVYFPPGNYLTGTISLRNHVTLYLEAGATLWASKNREDYSRGSLVYAEDVTNTAICGRGAIDGNGASFWTRIAGISSGGNHWRADKWRPEALLLFMKCTNLLLRDITLRNSPAWHIHPTDCDLLRIDGISILAGAYEEAGPNTDGIDPDGCSRVSISNCYIQSGDDAIVLKCGKSSRAPGKKRVCRDVTVANCVLMTNQTALKLGSESYGDFRNIAFSNCVIRDAGCGIGLWMRDGGLIDGWIVDNIAMTLTHGGQPIYMTQYPRSRLAEIGPPHPGRAATLGTVKNVMISNVEAAGCGGIFLQGMMEKHLESITFENIRLHVHRGRDKTKALNINPPYPFPVWGHRISPYGIYCRYVDGLALRNVQLTWEPPENPDMGSAIRCRSVRNLELDGFSGRQSGDSGEPAILLADTHNAFIHNCWPPEGTGDFLHLERGSRNVSVMGNNLDRAKRAAHVGSGVAATELYMEGNRLPAGKEPVSGL